MSTTHQFTTRAQRAIAALPIDLQDEAELLAWELARDENRDLAETTLEAAATITALMTYAAEWDQDADEQLLAAHCPCFALGIEQSTCLLAGSCQGEPPITPARQRAIDKAAYHLAGGLQIRRVGRAYLIPSGTRGGIIHRVEGNTCSCEAGASGKGCWHVEAVRQMATTQKRAA